MLDFNQLRCFVAVAEELNFGRAAKRLHMTQPPLSRQIQLLEHQVGVSLFSRDSRTVQLTSAGRALLPEARTILRMVENAALFARRTGRGEVGSASLGFTAAAGYELLPEVVTRWRQGVPDVDMHLEEMVSRAQLDAIEGNRLDLGLVRPPFTREGLIARRLFREPLVAALPAQHPLATAPSLEITDFHREPFIMYAPHDARYFHDLVASVFARANVFPQYNHYVAQVHSVLSLVHAGLGVALVPHAATCLRYDGVIYRSVEHEQPWETAELYLVWKDGNRNPVLPRLIEAISELFSDDSGLGGLPLIDQQGTEEESE